MIGSFFTFVAPSDGYETRQIVAPNEHTGEELLTDCADDLEPIFSVRLPNGRQYDMVRILKDHVTDSERNTVSHPVRSILVRIKPVLAHGW
jgi:hypothetical protein